MKILAGLAVAACMMVSSASAATLYVVGLCETAGGTFGFTNPNPNTPISGSWTCPTAASLGVSPTVTSEFIVYDGDYSSGLTTPVTETTNFGLTGLGGANFAFATDTITTTGQSSSQSITCVSGGTFNQSTNLPPGVLSGCYDNATSGTLGAGATVLYTNTFNSGTALSGTGYAEIVYDYSVTSGTPEPVSMLLLGGGLLGLSIIGRKKFSRK